MGSNENGINVETAGVCHMVLLRSRPHLALRLEHGKCTMLHTVGPVDERRTISLTRGQSSRLK